MKTTKSSLKAKYKEQMDAAFPILTSAGISVLPGYKKPEITQPWLPAGHMENLLDTLEIRGVMNEGQCHVGLFQKGEKKMIIGPFLFEPKKEEAGDG